MEMVIENCIIGILDYNNKDKYDGQWEYDKKSGEGNIKKYNRKI